MRWRRPIFCVGRAVHGPRPRQPIRTGPPSRNETTVTVHDGRASGHHVPSTSSSRRPLRGQPGRQPGQRQQAPTCVLLDGAAARRGTCGLGTGAEGGASLTSSRSRRATGTLPAALPPSLLGSFPRSSLPLQLVSAPSERERGLP